jgi:pre-mRNA-splicing factor ATP-dependent RNA helicase DHX38/PRP16
MVAPAQAPKDDAFVHEIAIKLSRVLNIINPNDLLASRVIDIAKNSSQDGFINGDFARSNSNGIRFNLLTAAQAFGKFQASFLSELHTEIQSHTKEQQQLLLNEVSKQSHQTTTVAGVEVQESDVLSAEPVRQGGLVRGESGKQHTFKAPTKPFNNQPRSSILGLDRLAVEKRALQETLQNGDNSRKRQRVEDDREAVFKGT